MSQYDRQSHRDRMEELDDRTKLEGELLRFRGPAEHEKVIGFFAIQLAFATWIGGIFKRRKARKNDNG